MKPTIITKILSMLVLTVVLISCDDKNDGKELYELTFEKGSYEVQLKRKTPIMIRGGNRDYSLSVQDPEILDADVDLSSLIGMGDILVTGKKKGETILSVTDNLSHETVKLKIKVIEKYLNLKVVGGNHPALVKDILIFLINDEERSCYFISGGENNPRNIITKGKYEFTAEPKENGATPYLTLTYASDEKGHFTDAAKTDASIAPTSHKLDISGNPSYAYEYLAFLFDIDWEKLIQKPSEKALRETGSRILNMKEVETEKEIYTYFWNEKIPEGILE